MAQITVPWKTYLYYHGTLTDAEKNIYSAIASGLMQWEPKIHLPPCFDFKRVYDIFILVTKDFPFLYHVSNRLKGVMGPQAYVIPTYTMDKQTYDRNFAEVQKFLDNCNNQLSDQTAFDKLWIIHDSIRRHVVYHDTSTPNEHNILGTIIDRKAVCESISKAFKLLCDTNNIPCIVIFGRSVAYNGFVQHDGNLDSGPVNHAWNMVKLNDKWYLCDVTFDLGSGSETGPNLFRYDYFLCSDERFSRRHRPSPAAPLPACPEDFELHRKLGLYAASEADIKRIAKKAAPTKNREIVFELSPDYNIDEEKILDIIFKAIRGIPCKKVSYNFNDAMRIFHGKII